MNHHHVETTEQEHFNFSSSSSDEDNYYEQQNLQYDLVVETLKHAIQHEIPQLIQPREIHQRRYIQRDWAMGHDRLYKDYFAENPVYPEKYFRRRYRMRKHVFLRIQQACEEHDIEFHQRRDATGQLCLSPLQKVTAAMFMLGYGQSADKDDHYIRIGASTARIALLKFTEAVIAKFGEEYLRKPNASDLQRLLHIGEQRGFPGMVGSVDCMHWEWKNCPVGWKGLFQGRDGNASLILEAAVSQDTWIWHSFFGVPGSCNDLNVLHRSPLFDDLLNGRTPRISFLVNNNLYDKGYYLTDGIYPQWSAFIQSITLPQTPKQRLFAQLQEATRKDVERAFGILQARFAIVRNPSLAWDREILNKIMMTCIILHNMIVEDERDTYANYTRTTDFYELPPELNTTRNDIVQEQGSIQYSSDRVVDINVYLNNRASLRDKKKHQSLKADLIQHIWQKFGHGGN